RGSDPAALLGYQNCLLPRLHGELPEHGGYVIAHRPWRERERARDLARRLASAPGAQHVEFAIRERGALVAQHVGGDLGVYVAASGGDTADDRGHLVRPSGLR